MAEPLVIDNTEVRPGERCTIELPLPNLYTHGAMNMPVKVVRGKKRGPRIFLSGALHGDELNGVEIIRRVLAKIEPSELSGAVIAVPVVNVFGFINQSRYLPDRRDLNRSFPGSASGSLAGRIAHTFMNQIVRHCTFGIDLHTAAQNRTNLPQIRADLHDAKSRNAALAFGARAVIHSTARDGSLREAAVRSGARILVYEGGETLRFNEDAIDIGVRGILRVMSQLGMRKRAPRRIGGPSLVMETTSWSRARQSGVMHLAVSLGQVVEKKQILAHIADPYGDNRTVLRAPFRGLVIGHASNPLVHRGDAAIHLADLSNASKPSASSESTKQH